MTHLSEWLSLFCVLRQSAGKCCEMPVTVILRNVARRTGSLVLRG